MNKVGRNDPCPCGSGKKHKKCCEIQKPKKINAEIIRSAPQQAEGMNKVASLFFKGPASIKTAESSSKFLKVTAPVAQES